MCFLSCLPAFLPACLNTSTYSFIFSFFLPLYARCLFPSLSLSPLLPHSLPPFLAPLCGEPPMSGGSQACLTNSHANRYYFAASNTRKGVEYTFRIINFYKRTSMYHTGLRPLLYSDKMAKASEQGWLRYLLYV